MSQCPSTGNRGVRAYNMDARNTECGSTSRRGARFGPYHCSSSDAGRPHEGNKPFSPNCRNNRLARNNGLSSGRVGASLGPPGSKTLAIWPCLSGGTAELRSAPRMSASSACIDAVPKSIPKATREKHTIADRCSRLRLPIRRSSAAPALDILRTPLRPVSRSPRQSFSAPSTAPQKGPPCPVFDRTRRARVGRQRSG
jgi:hypothetical protein